MRRWRGQLRARWRKLEKPALRKLRAAIPPFQPLLPRFRAMLEDAVGGDAEGILECKELAELVKQWQSETGVATQFDFHTGEGGLQTRHQAQQHGHDTGMTGRVSRPVAAPPAGIRCGVRRPAWDDTCADRRRR